MENPQIITHSHRADFIKQKSRLMESKYVPGT